ncbi:MAG: bifunctional 3,4-dihydroxy-2-butanone-4-phosphate synthase/GTP cyclohydrolase II [Burkholderiaceae bacterium]|nr:bifunctional 3,4-dihydroxy-2-butanone-4-phosphate synthase/GTP cyclohydrolase II [Burkholderiaceae bacterium]
MTLASTPEIIAELAAGRMVILVDEEDRENEGDLVLAADFVTPEAVNFMARYGRGLICLTLTEERCRQLALPLMVTSNGTRHGTNFTVSIEAAEGVSTGISAADRARTVQAAVARHAQPSDIVQPGHIFPLMAQRGGVLMRAGHTEAGCDLARLAGLTPAAVICEILKDDGTMARLPDLVEFGARHELKIGAIADLIQYRSAHESLIERLSERPVETRWGRFRMVVYRDTAAGSPHLALVHGDIDPGRETLVRVHEPLSVMDLIEVDARTHSWPLERALSAIASESCGVAVLLNCAQHADALFAQLEQAGDHDAQASVRRRTGKMDLRTYGIGAQILKDLGVGRMRLLSQPRKMPSMTGFDLEVAGFEPGNQE